MRLSQNNKGLCTRLWCPHKAFVLSVLNVEYTLGSLIKEDAIATTGTQG